MQVTVGLRQVERDLLQQLLQSHSGLGGDGCRLFVQCQRQLRQLVALVEHRQNRHIFRAQLLEQLGGDAQLFVKLRRRDVADVEDQIRVHRLLQRRMEGLYQLVRQAADQSNRVDQHHLAAIRQAQRPGGRVERSKEHILCQNTGIG